MGRLWEGRGGRVEMGRLWEGLQEDIWIFAVFQDEGARKMVG